MIRLRLNAPSGAGCLPTYKHNGTTWDQMKSQCTFWCRVLTDLGVLFYPLRSVEVSMHLLVPGAYRQGRDTPGEMRGIPSQCTFWCRVLTDAGTYRSDVDLILPSQCTFWCRVLTDLAP